MSRAYGMGCDVGKCFEVERDVASGHLVGFVAGETIPSVAMELFPVMDAYHV